MHVLVVKITMLGGKIAKDFPFSIAELESIIFHGCVKCARVVDNECFDSYFSSELTRINKTLGFLCICWSHLVMDLTKIKLQPLRWIDIRIHFL